MQAGDGGEDLQKTLDAAMAESEGLAQDLEELERLVGADASHPDDANTAASLGLRGELPSGRRGGRGRETRGLVMIRRTGLAPWEFEFPFPGSLTSTSLRQAAAKTTSSVKRPWTTVNRFR